MGRSVSLESLGIDPDADLARKCADFYLLERMEADGIKPAAAYLKRVTFDLSREFSRYLDMAIGGELRHAIEMADAHDELSLPSALMEYERQARRVSLDRTKCWKVWLTLRDRTPGSVHWVGMVSEVFGWEEWGDDPSAGGKAWSTVARVLYDFLLGKIKPKMFVDRCFTLQHNNDYVFDKVYNVRPLQHALVLQAEDRYDELASFASPVVQQMWRQWNRRWAGRDPAWLGSVI